MCRAILPAQRRVAGSFFLLSGLPLAFGVASIDAIFSRAILLDLTRLGFIPLMLTTVGEIAY